MTKLFSRSSKLLPKQEAPETKDGSSLSALAQFVLRAGDSPPYFQSKVKSTLDADPEQVAALKY